MNLSLANKTALVCGSTSGIGLACAAALAHLGATVTLAARDGEKLKAAVSELPHQHPHQHSTVVADFANPAAARDAVATAISGGTTFHILINNTGGPPPGAAIDATADQLTAAFNSLLLSAHLITQALVPGMKAAGYGRIINISSTSIKQPIAGLAISNIIRPAVAAWAKCLATELGPFGITVNNVLPGYTDTERLQSLMKNRAAKQNTPEEKVRADIIAATPAARLGAPDEIAAAVAFLASPAAAYISGINLPVDGGRLGTL
ncbi:MAG: SDR family oxidoreductase [Phycisphaerales bacterium]